MKLNLPLLSLAVGAFAIGTSEFASMGLLPVIASGVGVSIPTAGMLVTAYAIGVMIGAAFVTLGFARLSRDRALIASMAIFTIGNILSALAGSYSLLMAARIITSMSHGAFFGIGSIVAASVVAPEKRASAVATMFMGLTIANIGGVPAATWLGQRIGWRMAFGAITTLGLAAMTALFVALPREAVGSRPDVVAEFKVLLRGDVVRALLTTMFGAGAMFTLYTYISPVLTAEAGASPALVTAMLVLVGIGFSMGNALGGRFADRSLDGSLIVFLAMLAAVLALFALFAHTLIVTGVLVLLWGIATFAVVPPLQTHAMQAAAEAPGLASSVNVGAFNLGNALAAAAGATVIKLGLGYMAVPAAGAVIALIGLAIVLTGLKRTEPRDARSGSPEEVLL